MEYEKGRKCPEWLEKAVFYQIYPQSFKDSNGDGIGDFGGIVEKLDYIRELGCTALWLNPCFMSPFMDGGYDISDYFRTAPRYGTNEDLKRLFEEVHRRGMHILLDLVPGHTSVEHPWFKESCRAEKNAFTDRYVWTDSIWEEPEGGSCIRGISERDGSCVVNYFSHQPALNYGYYKPDPAKPWQQPTDGEGPEATVRAMMEVMRFWLKLGCDGFRADMAGSLVKCDREGLGTIGVWQKIRRSWTRNFRRPSWFLSGESRIKASSAVSIWIFSSISSPPITMTCSAASTPSSGDRGTRRRLWRNTKKAGRSQEGGDSSASHPAITIWTVWQGGFRETVWSSPSPFSSPCRERPSSITGMRLA